MLLESSNYIALIIFVQNDDNDKPDFENQKLHLKSVRAIKLKI